MRAETCTNKREFYVCFLFNSDLFLRLFITICIKISKSHHSSTTQIYWFGQISFCTSWFRRAAARFWTSLVSSMVPLIILLSDARDWWMLWTSLTALYCSSLMKEIIGASCPVLSLGGLILELINWEPYNEKKEQPKIMLMLVLNKIGVCTKYWKCFIQWNYGDMKTTGGK